MPFEDVRFHAQELAEVIIGRAMNDADRNEVIALVHERYPGATISEALITPGELRLQKRVVHP